MSEAEAMRADFQAMLAEMTGMAVCMTERDGGELCLRAATARVEAGCVHEHVFVEEVCERCADAVEASVASCNACRQGGDGHECQLLGRRLP